MNKSFPGRDNLDFWLKIILVLIVILAGLKWVLINWEPEKPQSGPNVNYQNDKSDFAKCLNEKGWIMYGVDTCEYCQEQKKIFGQAFEKIKYVNCDFDRTCLQKGITRYPVWENHGRILAGTQTFKKLAEESGCSIPKLTK